MKLLTKPISSSPRRPQPPPTTNDNCPPPLMKFLRNKKENKSSTIRRRRSRASPMFIRKKHIDQEPSSPKVTCIGQIRIRTTTTTTTNRRKNYLCGCFSNFKTTSFYNVLTKWVSFLRCGYCNNTIFLQESGSCSQTSLSRKLGDKFVGEKDDEKKDVDKKVDFTNNFNSGSILDPVQLFIKDRNSENVQILKEKEDGINDGLILKSPPKNAFLLTRCRSAPYRSSSLASKLCELKEVEGVEKVKDLKIHDDDDEGVNGDENGVKGLMEIKVIDERDNEMPLVLSRCKSEPARTWNQILV